jgi:MFS family permease
MWIPIALVPLWIYKSHGDAGKPVAVIFFLVMIFMMHCGQAIGGPGWMGWMSDLVPPQIRGTYFSRRRQWGLLSAIPAAWGAGWLLDHYALTTDSAVVMTWCAVVFLVACFFGTLDIITFFWVPEVPTEPKKGSDLLRAWGEPLRDRNYLWFAGFVATLIFAISFMGQFVTLFIMRQLGADNVGGQSKGLNQITQLMLLVAPMLAQLLVFPFWGRAADRMGKRPLLVLASLGMVPVALAWCFVTRETIWLGYVLSALGGALWAGIDVANFNMVLEFSGSARKTGTKGGTAYASVNAVIINIAGCLGGLASGAIAEWLKDFHWQAPLIGDFTFFHVLFILSGILRLASVVIFLPYMHEPEARPAVEALRYMTSNIYNNLFAAVMQPLRLVGFRNEEPEQVANENRDETPAAK